MCSISSSKGSSCNGETSGESGDVGEAFTRKSYYQELRAKANTVPIIGVFFHYGIVLDKFNCKTTCPFPFHKGGKERTPSFYYYSPTNTFYCYGCNNGGGPVEFVKNIEEISPIKAAQKVIDIFGKKIGAIPATNYSNYAATIKLLLKLSTAIREFRQEFFDKKSQEFIEEVCASFDKLYARHKFDEASLEKFVQELIREIDYYKCKQ